MDVEGGYLIDWLDYKEDELEKKEIFCTICQCVFREPVHADNTGSGDDEPCGHIFCNVCIRKWLDTDQRCPTCKRQLTKAQLRPDMDLRRKIRALTTKCHIDPKMCDMKGQIGKDGIWWTEHDKVCGYKQIACPACRSYYERKSIRLHLTECPAVLGSCEFQCGTLLTRKDRKEHEDKCSSKMTTCGKCGQENIPVGRLNSHLDLGCKDIPCDFNSVGCPSLFTTNETQAREKHMITDTNTHMNLMLQEITNLRCRLGLYSASTTPLEEVTFYWSMHWEPASKATESPILARTHGVEWRLTFGNTNLPENSLPLYVHCVNTKAVPLPKLNVSMAILHPATGICIDEKQIIHSFWNGSACGHDFGLLKSLETKGAIDRAIGFAFLLFRVKLRCAT